MRRRRRHARGLSASRRIVHSERVGARSEPPGFVTHYHLAGRRPFLSLSELDDVQLAAVLADLRALRQAGKQHRPFGPRHMELRRRTEARLRELFVAAGGRPERPAPHYFVLGDSSWYQGLAENMEHVCLPLSALPPAQTSITYPDSFTAVGSGTQPGIGREPRPATGGCSSSTNCPGSLSSSASRNALEWPVPDVDHLARGGLYRSPALDRRAHRGLSARLAPGEQAGIPGVRHISASALGFRFHR